MEKAALLSHFRIVAPRVLSPRSWRSFLIHKTSQVVRARALYSASAKEQATTDCFLDF